MIILGVIPARGGSKGLPGKNLKPLDRLPLIGWSIRAAKQSRLLTRTWISTEDTTIAKAAQDLGAEVPFTRPIELASDEATTVSVLQHAVTWYTEKVKGEPDLIVLLQPTSPLRRPEEIDACIRLVVDTGADSAQTVAEDKAHPWHRYRLENGCLRPLHPEAKNFSRRQEAPPLYRPTGSVYVVRTTVLMKESSMHGADHRGLVCPFETSIDIDDAFDLQVAELMLRRAQGIL